MRSLIIGNLVRCSWAKPVGYKWVNPWFYCRDVQSGKVLAICYFSLSAVRLGDTVFPTMALVGWILLCAFFAKTFQMCQIHMCMYRYSYVYVRSVEISKNLSSQSRRTVEGAINLCIVQMWTTAARLGLHEV